MTLGEGLRRGRERHPEKTALRFESERWSYAQLDAMTDRIGASLLRGGVSPGDRVAILLTNCPEMVFSFYACFKIGAIAVPLSPRLKGPELEYVLGHCSARGLITRGELFPEVQRVRSSLPGLAYVYVTDAASPIPDVRSFGELLEPETEGCVLPRVTADTVAVVLYTSGTTARPKGVIHTHASLARSAATMAENADIRPEDVLAIAAPLCHASGLMCHLTPAIRQGATVVIIPRPAAGEVLQAMAQQRATWIFGLPVLLNNLVHCPEAASCDVSSLRVCVAGGDAVTPELQRRFRDAFGVEVVEGWGMTEIIPGFLNPIHGVNKIGAIGPPVRCVSARLIHDSGQDVAPGEVGEILVKGAAVTVGYWNDPEVTAASLQDGWLRTGDLARRDEDGYYWFVGRKKEIIIRGGSNISPLEVEEALCQHPAVHEAGVVGVPDPTWGEIVHAYVSLQPDRLATEANLKQFLQDRLSSHKVPERIHFLPELPKGATGKVHRKTLRDQAAAAGAG